MREENSQQPTERTSLQTTTSHTLFEDRENRRATISVAAGFMSALYVLFLIPILSLVGWYVFKGESATTPTEHLGLLIFTIMASLCVGLSTGAITARALKNKDPETVNEDNQLTI